MLNKKKVALLGAMAAVAMASTGAQAATATATADVDIIAAVQLQQLEGLDFGTVASSATAGTVVLPSGSNVRTCTAQVTCVGPALRGRFTVSGATSGYVVSINVPGTVSLTSTTGGAPMTVELLPSTTTINTTSSAQEFFIGGNLAVGAYQAAGNYTAEYTVTANYQ